MVFQIMRLDGLTKGVVIEMSRGPGTESWDPPAFIGQEGEERPTKENEKKWTVK